LVTNDHDGGFPGISFRNNAKPGGINRLYRLYFRTFTPIWPRGGKKSDHYGIIIIFHELSFKKFILTFFPAFLLEIFEKMGHPCRVAHLPENLIHFLLS